VPNVSILGVSLSLNQVRDILTRQMGIPELSCEQLQDPANEARIKHAIERLVLDVVEPLIGMPSNCNMTALDVVLRLGQGIVQEQGIPYDAALAIGIDRALCEIQQRVAGVLSSFLGTYVRPIYAILVNSCRESGQGAVDPDYGVPAFETQPPALPPPSTSPSPAPSGSGPPVGTVVVTRTSVPRPDSGSTSGSNVWAPTAVSKKTSMVPIAIAGGVALAVSAVILSRRR
jgi:hypothetical protein